MKIISGILKGRIIPVIKNPKYRPSTGKFKESLFSILTSLDINLFFNKSVLDLFAGTGSLGFEALSRGANRVTFVDIEDEHIKTIKNFANKINSLAQINCLRLDATNLTTSHIGYDIIFVDPPYYKSLIPKTLKSLVEKRWLNPGCVIILELEKNEILKLDAVYNISSERIIGKAKLIILRYLSETI